MVARSDDGRSSTVGPRLMAVNPATRRPGRTIRDRIWGRGFVGGGDSVGASLPPRARRDDDSGRRNGNGSLGDRYGVVAPAGRTHPRPAASPVRRARVVRSRQRATRRSSSTASIRCCCLSRTTTISTRWPARWPRRANVRSSSVFTVTPANCTMMSPARTPAFSAGLPGRTPLILAPGSADSPKSGTTPKTGPYPPLRGSAAGAGWARTYRGAAAAPAAAATMRAVKAVTSSRPCGLPCGSFRPMIVAVAPVKRYHGTPRQNAM
jgi:hypothetical protein